MKYLRLYNHVSEHQADRAHFTENRYSTCYMKEDNVVEYHTNQEPQMTVAQLVEAGYAEVKQDKSEVYRGGETAYTVVQIHSACPVTLENIIDFDEVLVSATTFVWREALPVGWNVNDLMAKYDGTELGRPLSVELFSALDLHEVDDLTLSFTGARYYWPQSSVISQRKVSGNNTATFQTPKHLTINVRGEYSSVAQTVFSMLRTTTGLTLDFDGPFTAQDVSGMFEEDWMLNTIEMNDFRWNTMVRPLNMFYGCNSLTAVPYSSMYTREHQYNTLYPHTTSNGQGDANCYGLFHARNLQYIGPVVNMNAISLSGCVVDGVNQAPLKSPDDPTSGIIKHMFFCPLCTDVRIINLNNNDWNFVDGSTYTHLPLMDTTSIEYLLNNVADCTSNQHTVTFSTLHQNDVSSAAISAAAAKGWTVAWQAPAND